MGFPLKNNYDLLRTLAFGDVTGNQNSDDFRNMHSTDVQIFIRSLRKFKLFAFVIHDPKAHADFHNYLGKVFDFLDFTTGANLLFFALTDPPSEWSARAQSRKYYRSILAFQNMHHEKIFEQPENTNNPSLSAQALATALGIRFEDLPVIVVTNNLSGKIFKWCKTSKERLKDQLNELGHMAYLIKNNAYEFDYNNFLINRHSASTDHFSHFDQKELTMTLAKALSDVLALIRVSNNDMTHDYSVAERQATVAVKSLVSAIREHKENQILDDDSAEIFDQLNVQLAAFLSVANQNREMDSLVDIEFNYLENESQIMLQTAMSVSKLFSSNSKIICNVFGGSPDYDYTSVGICLAKMMELEFNLSIVHWMREKLGITMPDYFNKYNPSCHVVNYIPDNIGLPNPQAINFNKGYTHNSQWVAPGIGQSRLCFESMVRKDVYGGKPDFVDENILNKLIDYWREIAHIRNNFAHSAIAHKSTLDKLTSHLNALNRLGVFAMTTNLKNSMRTC
jgi:hypothetical protein